MKKILTAALGLIVASCATAPTQRAPIAQAPVVLDNPLTMVAELDAEMMFGSTDIRPGDYRIVPAAAMPRSGPVAIVVSLRNQRTYVYKAGQLVAVSTSSHGVPEHPTDPGQFTILQKELFHRSNKYSNLPSTFSSRKVPV